MNSEPPSILNGFDGIGHLFEDRVEELGGVFCSGLFARPGDGPFGEGIVGVEMLDGDAGQRIDREGVDLDDVAGLFEGNALGFSDGVGALLWRCFGGDFADQGGNGLNRSAPDERADDPPDGGVGCGVALFAQDRPELFLAPHGVIQAQALDGFGQTLWTLGLAHPAWPTAQGIGARLPAVEGGPRDAHSFGPLLAAQPLRHGVSPARQRVTSSGGFDIRGLRRQKTRRAPGTPDNMTGQAKNLHGVLL